MQVWPELISQLSAMFCLLYSYTLHGPILNYLYVNIDISISQSINQSIALSASCARYTRTQSHAALYNEVIVGWWRQRLQTRGAAVSG